MDQLYRHQLGKLSLSDYDFNRRYLCDPWSRYPKILRFYFQDHAIRCLISDVDFHEADTNKLSIIDEIKFYFDINYAENLKLKDIADYFGIHQNYLTRAFHEKFGISPKKYLLQLKFKKAARLLATTQLPVSIISNSLGFEDQLAFSRTFKKFYNVSPTDYRSHLKP